MSRDGFEAAFRRIQEHLAAGETYQANLSLRLRAPLGPEPHRRLALLALGSGTPWAAFLDCGRFLVASASPELFFDLGPGPGGASRVVCRPMKGTAPRGRTLGEELEHARRLAASPKERSENVMVLDMVRNDLGRIARPGSVEVSRVFHVERYPTVLQMTSTVTAETDAGAPEIFAALFPSASITGAPKIAASRILAAVETTPRGVYTGAVGYLAPGGRARFNVAIRTITADLETGTLEQGVGSGVVRDSRAGSEWAECLLKARWAGGRVDGIAEDGGAGEAGAGVAVGGRAAEPGTPAGAGARDGSPASADPPGALRLLETLLWRPGQGYFLLADHLERLARSAAWFSFDVDPQALRRRLEAHGQDLPQRFHRVRLTVGRDGDAVVESHPLELASEPLRPLRVALAAEPVDGSDPLLSHKTTHRAVYERARASRPGCDDVLLVNRRGEVTESTIANLVLRHRGRSITPPRSCGLLAGTLRERLVRSGAVREEVVRPAALEAADELWLVSSVRGWRRVEIVPGEDREDG